MKKIKWIVVLLSILLNCNCSIAKQSVSETSLLLAIDFQDNFKNDIVSFYIENCLIFDGIELVSIGVLGTTGKRVRIYEDNEMRMLIEYNDKEVAKCNIPKKIIQMKVILNGEEYEITIDLNKGKYVGLGVVNENTIYPFQSELPFSYY